MIDGKAGRRSGIESLFSPLMETKPPPGLGFAHGALDRSAQLRTRPEFVEALRQAPEARFYAFCSENAVLRRENDLGIALFAADELPFPDRHQEVVFLGREGEAGRFAVLIAPDVEEALKEKEEFLLIGLRALALDGRLPADQLGAIAQGKAMLHWHATHRFCSKCGHASAVAEQGWKRICPSCQAEHFPRTDPVVIMLTVDGDRCLLGRSARFPPGWYSTLAGFVEPGETIEDAVRRETFEEAGILGGRVTIMANQPWPFPASLMIGAYVEARSTTIAVDLDELEDCRWFGRDEVRQMIAGTHPDGLGVPAKMSIASHLIRHFVEDAAGA
ncbi:MAG: NAD(+) diphosphatase [Beijerinckiaceae bacterium]|jgi:NAD+ diphosphatase|nr:NAD(+) diphosphatase [Beijerinckiaceae bacterium]